MRWDCGSTAAAAAAADEAEVKATSARIKLLPYFLHTHTGKHTLYTHNTLFTHILRHFSLRLLATFCKRASKLSSSLAASRFAQFNTTSSRCLPFSPSHSPSTPFYTCCLRPPIKLLRFRHIFCTLCFIYNCCCCC